MSDLPFPHHADCRCNICMSARPRPFFVSKHCMGEHCFCGLPAAHKVEEVILSDDPIPTRHPLTTYICRAHFRQIMGPAAGVRP